MCFGGGRTELPTPCMIKFPFAALICTGLRRAGCECLSGTPSGEATPLPMTFRGRLAKKKRMAHTYMCWRVYVFMDAHAHHFLNKMFISNR